MICNPPERTGKTRRGGRGLLGWLALLALLAPVSDAQTEVTFRLVPEALWNEGRPDRSHFLPSGRVFLYRAGSYSPELVAEANQPQVVTPGRWLWISEAWDGNGDYYVSVVSGKIHYPEGAERFDRGLIGPVVPACRVDLGSAESWQGIARLDAVSLDRQAVYPVIVDARRDFHVPEGRFLAYAMDSRGVVAISRVASCSAGETLELSRPEPPAAWHQDLMVSVQVPEGMADELSALLTPSDASGNPVAPQPPTAVLRTKYRATFFFLDADAREPLVLQIRHPELLAHRQEISPVRGGVRELPDVVLEPRAEN